MLSRILSRALAKRSHGRGKGNQRSGGSEEAPNFLMPVKSGFRYVPAVGGVTGRQVAIFEGNDRHFCQ